MLICWDVPYLEIEEEHCRYPTVDGSVWLDIGVVDHPFDKLGVHLHKELLNSNDVDPGCSV